MTRADAVHNLLADSLIRARLSNGRVEALSLPKVYEVLATDRVDAFPALRPHQRHAWHAFLAQLGAIALYRAGRDTPPESTKAWCSLIRGLTRDFGGDEPWRLIVEDPAQPAFMQCPAPKGLGDHRRRVMTPDDLDILVTAKNHDLKQAVALRATPEDWTFALIDLQTMAGFFGAGNYGVARMNGGYSTRPCLGLAPAKGGLGAHLFHDMKAMLAKRNELLNTYSDYFKPDDGAALLWLLPWEGSGSLDLRALDPYFIEICRRVRLRREDDSIIALTAGSKVPRISAKAANGNVGDFWTPVSTKDGKALSLSHASLRYDRLVNLLFEKAFRHPPAMKVRAAGEAHWQLVARGVAGGQGKTEGYYERTDIAFAPKTVLAFSREEQRDKLARFASEQMDEIREVNDALRFGIATAASGGKPASELTKADRAHAAPYSHRLDAAADARFFRDLERRFSAADEAELAASRAALARAMIDAADQLLNEAIESVPCAAIHRHRARARAVSAFWGRLRSTRSVFSDQAEIFDGREVLDAAS